MTIDMSQFYEVFFDEAEELLAEAERLLLAINMDAPDDEELNAIFRAAHSIKGGAATFGFMDMTEITHVLENLLDKIRKHEMTLTAEHVDAFLAAKDVLKMELDGHRNASPVDQDQVADVKMVLKSLSEGGSAVKAEAPQATAAPAEAPVAPAIPQMPVVQASDAPLKSDRPGFSIIMPEITEKDFANLKEELALLGDIETSKLTTGRYRFVLKTSDSSKEDIVSICSFIINPDEMQITALEVVASLGEVETSHAEPAPTSVAAAQVAESDENIKVDEEEGYGFFIQPKGEDQKEEGYGFFAPFQPHPDAPKVEKIGDDTPLPDTMKTPVVAAEAAPTPVAPTPAVASATPAAAAAPAGFVEKRAGGRRESDKQPSNSETTSIRVGIEKVDQLINLVGELVITQAMIEQRINSLDPVHHEKLINSVGQLTRNTRDLQEAVMSIRMIPMDFVFSRFPRMVRDLAAKLNKKVDFITQGATTELDKGLIERIVDPLTHLVRNSVDHGIETPDKRKAAGKPEMGRLTLSAAHKGGSIVIEVADDGGGLNRDKILAKARSNGLPVNENMTDNEVHQLIFAPGFSTAEVVTDISGRGVGMDVVKRNITQMGGSVEIRSIYGKGTTISIALPLTLAILDGMSVSLGENLYVIPLNLIVETVQPRMEDIKTVTGEGLMVNVRGEYLPIIPLYALFNQDTEITHPTEGVLVILEAEGKKAALFVDGLVGQQQVVIKSLETNFRKIQGVSGATIMGDGSVALILDVPAIIKMGQNNLQGAY